MNVQVEEQTKRFYLAFEKSWKPFVGHGIKIDDYYFCAIPVDGAINVSEVTTGLHVITIPLTWEVEMVTATKESTMNYFQKIGEVVGEKIQKQADFDKKLEKVRLETTAKLGERPDIETVDTDWVFAEESDTLN